MITHRSILDVWRNPRLKLVAVAAVLLLVASACGDDDTTDTTATATTQATTAATEAPTTTAAPVELDTVRYNLGWIPFTTSTGFWVGQRLGFYEEAGINLEIVPYANTAPDSLVDAGTVECGENYPDYQALAIVGAGMNETSIMTIGQMGLASVTVLETSDIQRPRDLDGKVYGGFGAIGEQEYIEALIQADGGVGDFTLVNLQASTYDALVSGQVDFVIGFDNYEVIDAELRGAPLRVFRYDDYGIPPTYSALVSCNRDWLEANPDVARRFVEATIRSWQWANDNPDDAVEILIEENIDTFTDDFGKEWMREGQRWQTENQWNFDENGNIGCQKPEIFIDGSQWLFDAGVYTDADGNPLTEAPDATSFYTNEFLPDYCNA